MHVKDDKQEEKEEEREEKEETASEEKEPGAPEGEEKKGIPKEKLSAINIDSTNQYIRKISTIDHKISREETHDLWKRVKRGDRRAKQRLLELNLKLVIPIAKRFLYPGADLMDLVEEGNLGLLHAIDKFDIRKGYRFSTYASYWVEQYVRRSVEETSRTIRVPPHAWTALRKWLKQWDCMHGKLGRDPTLAEMAKQMHWTANQVRTALNASEVMTGLSSIETPLGHDDGSDTVGDTLQDHNAGTPDNLISILRLHDELKDALVEIGERERMIVELRYGLTGQTAMTLNEIGQKLSLSRERVRQIEERALLRLRRVAARMGLIEMSNKGGPTNIQPGWNQPKQKTDLLGDAIPTKPYVPRKQEKGKK
ncbi:MAG: RNA polymerase sigma factor [Elusimicrobia bacterium]|nr:MAG: RNA polymerase sigma factor [Elusimicrobiota bacterium]KAF0156477.1 MAG: RNA polymerase sigma factor [Elusimicrobiota bacterium]